MNKILMHLEYILIIPLAIISIILAPVISNIFYFVFAFLMLEVIAYMLLSLNKHILGIISGIITFINGAFSIVILLLFALSKLNGFIPLYYQIYVIFYLGFKIFTLFYYRKIKTISNVIYKELSIVMIMLIINLILCVFFYIIGDDIYLFRYSLDKDISNYNIIVGFIVLFKASTNFITSNFVAYYTTSSLILLKENRIIGLKEKIKDIIYFFQKYNITFILGEIFTTFLYVNYQIKASTNDIFQTMASFYLFILVLRTIIFTWHLIIKKKFKNEPYKLYRANFIILIVTSASIILLNNSLNAVLVAITTQNNNPDALPIWWLLLVTLPFSGYSFVHAILSYRESKISDDAYLLSYSNLSLISSSFMLFGSIVYILAKIGNKFAAIVWLIVISLVISIGLYVSIKSLIIGIKGIAGKRKKKDDFISNEVIISKDE